MVYAITNEAFMGGDVSVLLAEARTAVTTAARDRQEARTRLATEKANRSRLKLVSAIEAYEGLAMVATGAVPVMERGRGQP